MTTADRTWSPLWKLAIVPNASVMGDMDDAVYYSFFDKSHGEPQCEIENSLRDDFALSYLLGSECDESHILFQTKYPSAIHLSFSDLDIFMAREGHEGSLKVMEMFGGEGGVTRLAIRRRLKTGTNFDVVCRVNLTDPVNEHRLLSYVTRHKPLVVVGGPPCSAVASWSRYNRLHNPVGYAKTRHTGLKLARVFARVASI